MKKEVSAYLIKLRREHPFLATLSLHMDYQFSDKTNYFDTDGIKARINNNYFNKLSSSQRLGTLLHITLHCALLHHIRGHGRESSIWNIAADIVVNQIISDSNFNTPPKTAVEPRYKDLSVEQIYNKLLKSAKNLKKESAGQGQDSQKQHTSQIKLAQNQTLDENTQQTINANQNNQGLRQEYGSIMQRIYPSVKDVQPNKSQDHPNSDAKAAKLETYWKRAIVKAQTVDKMEQKHQGQLPAGLIRNIDDILNPQLDWRTILWRFMSKTPCDYSGFDRRFFHQGLYLEQLEGESLNVYIAIDTSGSIDDIELTQFLSEVEAITRCYVNIKVKVYCVDADVYGPYSLDQENKIKQVHGGGGTDFSEFFSIIEKTVDQYKEGLCIYFTDGFGDFPEKTPLLPVLWVVSSEGSNYFPFGDVTYLNII